jgi:hypothetical protein
VTDVPMLSPELRAGRRALEGIAGLELLGDWRWDSDEHKWVLHCRLSPGIAPTEFLPPVTEWHVTVDPSYPWGAIKIYPDEQMGIKSTFPHQMYNGRGNPDKPWRIGEMCVRTPLRVLARQGLDIEPDDVHSRLRWHMERALEWLVAASQGDLVRDGDPFELPEFPAKARVGVAFMEGPETYSYWQNSSDVVGMVELSDAVALKDYIVARAFLNSKSDPLWELGWGNALSSDSGNRCVGLWIRLRSVPALKPWQAPTSWRELRQACRVQGISIDDQLVKVAKGVRDGLPHFALIGFPVPEIVGGPSVAMHWQALVLPVLSWGARTAQGFRPNETGHWHRDRTELLTNDTQLEWVLSENWHQSQLTSRGSLPGQVTASAFLVIGAGALGSAVAELLVRAGVRGLTVIDGEILEAGNLVRHSLLLPDVRESKAVRIAARLNLISPNARVEALSVKFPPTDAKALERIGLASAVIDCTGEDDVLNSMDHFVWGSEKLFVSLSLGMRARRLYCFVAHGTRFPHGRFRDAMKPWLLKEAQENAGLALPREGIGCWHPVFPARADDVSLMAAVAVRQVERAILRPATEPSLSVFETYDEDGGFGGIRCVK